MGKENIQFINHEGVIYNVLLSFVAKETCVGDKLVSYQLLRMKRSGLFTIDELYKMAATIQELQPDSLINWAATFELLEKQKPSQLRRKLKAFHLL